MITPAEVEAFDDDAYKRIVRWEETIDAALKKDKKWSHTFSSGHHPSEWATTMRRYHDNGWAVMCVVSKGVDSCNYVLAITHPAHNPPAGTVTKIGLLPGQLVSF